MATCHRFMCLFVLLHWAILHSECAPLHKTLLSLLHCDVRRYARVFVFCYTLALHLLIMGVLARWSHRHSTDLASIELLCAQQVRLHFYSVSICMRNIPTGWCTALQQLPQNCCVLDKSDCTFTLCAPSYAHTATEPMIRILSSLLLS